MKKLLIALSISLTTLSAPTQALTTPHLHTFVPNYDNAVMVASLEQDWQETIVSEKDVYHKYIEILTDDENNSSITEEITSSVYQLNVQTEMLIENCDKDLACEERVYEGMNEELETYYGEFLY